MTASVVLWLGYDVPLLVPGRFAFVYGFRSVDLTDSDRLADAQPGTNARRKQPQGVSTFDCQERLGRLEVHQCEMGWLEIMEIYLANVVHDGESLLWILHEPHDICYPWVRSSGS